VPFVGLIRAQKHVSKDMTLQDYYVHMITTATMVQDDRKKEEGGLFRGTGGDDCEIKRS